MGQFTKLAPRYRGPFQILERIGPVAYRLTLPTQIKIHDGLHVMLLKTYFYNPRHVISWQYMQVNHVMN